MFLNKTESKCDTSATGIFFTNTFHMLGMTEITLTLRASDDLKIHLKEMKETRKELQRQIEVPPQIKKQKTQKTPKKIGTKIVAIIFLIISLPILGALLIQIPQESKIAQARLR